MRKNKGFSDDPFESTNIYLNAPVDIMSWWNNVHSAWPMLLKILDMTLDLSDPPPPDCDTLNAECLGDYIQYLKDDEDPLLVVWLEQAWFLGPDLPETYSVPGWIVLTDLVSEKHVLMKNLDGMRMGLLDLDVEDNAMALINEEAYLKREKKDWRKFLENKRKSTTRRIVSAKKRIEEITMKNIKKLE